MGFVCGHVCVVIPGNHATDILIFHLKHTLSTEEGYILEYSPAHICVPCLGSANRTKWNKWYLWRALNEGNLFHTNASPLDRQTKKQKKMQLETAIDICHKILKAFHFEHFSVVSHHLLQIPKRCYSCIFTTYLKHIPYLICKWGRKSGELIHWCG